MTEPSYDFKQVMSAKVIDGLPDYLVPLLEPIPSGVAKLVAAWSGLNTESQIAILKGLESSGHPSYLAEKIRVKALDSTAAYVRYLAARRLHFRADDPEEKRAIKRRIEEDSEPLVRYCLLEHRWGLPRDLADADAFFALPHDARLAKIRSLHGSGLAMANLVGHAVDHQLKDGTVSAVELFEILSDYVQKAEFKEYYAPANVSNDGSTEYSRGKSIEALWRLALKLPEGVSHVLIENLPPSTGLSSGIPEDVLSGMSDVQLTTLFNREDIELKELRKKVFFDVGEKTRDEVRVAALRYNFDLDPAEFGAILALPKSEAGKIIADLHYAHNLSLWLYEAIYDVLLNGDVGDPLYADFAREDLERRLEQLEGAQREKQLRDLNLYQLAKTAVPWKKEEEGYLPSGELEFLSKVVVKGDTWGTFVAYTNALANNNSRESRMFENYLFQLDDTDKEEPDRMDDKGEGERTERLVRIEEKIMEVVPTLTDQAERKFTDLAQSLKKLSTDIVRLQAAPERQTQIVDEHIVKFASTTIEKTHEITRQLKDNLEQLKTNVDRLQALQQRHGLVLYVVVGLLAWLLAKFF